MSIHCRGKSAWPELVGSDGEEAVAKITGDNPTVKIARTFSEGAMVTGDFRCDRVRVYVDKNGTVTRVPHIG